MSEEITRFNEDVKNSQSMQEEIKSLGSDLDAVVSYAQNKGYNFSKEDVAALSEDQDLSDDELDAAAGGQIVLIAGVSAGAILIAN